MTKTKQKILGFALSVSMIASCFTGMSVTASADDESTYTITIPSSLTVANSGWNSIGNISASGTLEDGKKLNITATSANSWALKSGDNSVTYTLNNGSDTKGDAATSWDFTKEQLTAGATQAIGIDVADYSTKPAGTYTDTVTFTASVEQAKQLHSFTLTGPYTHNTLLVEFYDGDKWSDMVAKYSLITNPAQNYVGFSTDGFINGAGDSWVTMDETVDPNVTYYVQ